MLVALVAMGAILSSLIGFTATITGFDLKAEVPRLFDLLIYVVVGIVIVCSTGVVNDILESHKRLLWYWPAVLLVVSVAGSPVLGEDPFSWDNAFSGFCALGAVAVFRKLDL